MDISAKRLNGLVNLATQASMAVLRAGLPEFTGQPLKDLKSDIEMQLSDLIESHVAGLTEEEESQ